MNNHDEKLIRLGKFLLKLGFESVEQLAIISFACAAIVAIALYVLVAVVEAILMLLG